MCSIRRDQSVRRDHDRASCCSLCLLTRRRQEGGLVDRGPPLAPLRMEWGGGGSRVTADGGCDDSRFWPRSETAGAGGMVSCQLVDGDPSGRSRRRAVRLSGLLVNGVLSTRKGGSKQICFRCFTTGLQRKTSVSNMCCFVYISKEYSQLTLPEARSSRPNTPGQQKPVWRISTSTSSGMTSSPGQSLRREEKNDVFFWAGCRYRSGRDGCETMRRRQAEPTLKELGWRGGRMWI